MTKIKYKVTGLFGWHKRGDILSAWLITQDRVHALVYHPAERANCMSFEICKLNKDGLWVSVSRESYVNEGPMNRELRAFLKKFK